MRNSLRSRLMLRVALPVVLIYVAFLSLTLNQLKSLARSQAEHRIEQMARLYADRIDDRLRELAQTALGISRAMEVRPETSADQIANLLRAGLKDNPLVYGSAMAFEPGAWNEQQRLFCPYVYRDGTQLALMDIGRDGYDYADGQWSWWNGARESGRPSWCEPYFDEGAGNILMSTYSAPFLKDGRFWGIATADLSLVQLREHVGLEELRELNFVLISRSGHYVYHPQADQIGHGSLQADAEALGRTDLEELNRQIREGRSGLQVMPDWLGQNTNQWVFYAPVTSAGWSFVARLSETQVMAYVQEQMWRLAAAMLLTLGVIVASLWWISGRISDPVVRLNRAVRRIAEGDLSAQSVPVEGDAELAELASSFNRMSADLKHQVDQLAFETAAREKLERDLDLARSIQQGLFPDRPLDLKGFDLAGWNQAAEATGGDYYDWVHQPDGRVCFCIADVTGHGIGPALLMAICRAYFRSLLALEKNIQIIFHRLNALMHADMPAGRFVTAAGGILDPTTGALELFSAGQAPLFYYRAADKQVDVWDADDLPLGITDEGMDDPARQLVLAPGDCLVLLTDGFMEWIGPQEEVFGTERLKQSILTHGHKPASAIITALYEDVQQFAAGSPQADDLTAVILKRL